MQIVTAAEASEFLNIRLQRVYELVRQRSIPYVKLGARQLRFDLDELKEWVRRGGTAETTSMEPSQGTRVWLLGLGQSEET